MDDSARSCYAGIVLQAIQGLLESDATSVHLLIPILGVLLQVRLTSVNQALLSSVPGADKLQEPATGFNPVYAVSHTCRASSMLGSWLCTRCNSDLVILDMAFCRQRATQLQCKQSCQILLTFCWAGPLTMPSQMLPSKAGPETLCEAPQYSVMWL